MCGIIGYYGPKPTKSLLLDGLLRLEYRGYDSAGIALIDTDHRLQRIRAVGKVAQLVHASQSVGWDGQVGIAHTRWATHGVPNESNTHPHTNQTQTLAVVHNGIIENYQPLRKQLEQSGITFASDTDTEVLAHLIDRYYQSSHNLAEALKSTLLEVTGTYGVAVIHQDQPNMLVAARKGSPLILGIGTGEYIIASDMSAIAPHTRDVIFLEDEEIVIISPEGYQIESLNTGTIPSHFVQTIDFDTTEIGKEGYPHFMKKEIFEQGEALRSALRGRIHSSEGDIIMGGFTDLATEFSQARRILIVSCGTSYYAGLVASYWIEELAGIPVQVEYASEFRYKALLVDSETIIITISQSGETADTIAALKEAQRKGAKVFGIVNVVGSTIARMADAGAYTHAGPEIGVASTKAFMTQLGVLALLAVGLGRQREISFARGQELISQLQQLPTLIESVLPELSKNIESLVKEYSGYTDYLYVGRQMSFPIALEGALKLKEISYVHAEGYASGEMKHGPIALIDTEFPTIAIVPQDAVYDKNISNLQEIKARSGKIIAIATEGDTEISDHADSVIYVPKTDVLWSPFVTTLAVQLWAYHTAVALEKDPDKPRNLAKSVTVE